MKVALSDKIIGGLDHSSILEGRERRTLWDASQKGLGLLIHKSGTIAWVLRYSMRGHNGQTTLGQWPDLPYAVAKKKAQSLRGQVADGIDPAKVKDGAKTVKDLAADFEKDYLPGLAASTSRTYKMLIKRHILPKIGRLLADEVALQDVARVHHALRGQPRTANQALAVLSRMLNLAERWGYRPVNSNPCSAIGRFPEAKRERYLTAEEMQTLGDKIRAEELAGWNPYTIAALRFAMLTGMRRGEVAGLKWTQIKGDKVIFTERREDASTASKTGAKTIPLNPPAKAILEGLTRMLGSPYVFPGEQGGPCTGSLKNLWYKLREETTFADVRLHDLRHTFASIGIMEGLTLEQIGGLLGHKAAATTKRYAHLMEEAARVAASKVGSEVVKRLG